MERVYTGLFFDIFFFKLTQDLGLQMETVPTVPTNSSTFSNAEGSQKVFKCKGLYYHLLCCNKFYCFNSAPAPAPGFPSAPDI